MSVYTSTELKSTEKDFTPVWTITVNLKLLQYLSYQNDISLHGKANMCVDYFAPLFLTLHHGHMLIQLRAESVLKKTSGIKESVFKQMLIVRIYLSEIFIP